MIDLGPEICGSLEAGTEREWLETNGIGGFASATVPGMNTRSYHGLLVAALRPPVDRFVLLSRFEEALVVGGQRFELSSNRYPGTVHPQGYRFLQRFRLDPFPTWTYECGGVTLEKSLFMVQGENTTVVEYRLLSAPARTPLTLELRPLLAFRDHHAVIHENEGLDSTFAADETGLTFRPYPELPPLYLAHTQATVTAEGYWYHSFLY